MKQFIYKARDKTGTVISGLVEALTAQAAARSMQERGLLVVDLTEKRSFSLQNLSLGSIKTGVPAREVATFTRLLSTMLATGLPIADAFSNLANQTRSGYFREVIRSILHDIQSGMAVSDSMSRYPQVFDNLYVNLVRAGEASGKLDESLGRMADTLEANLDFKARITGAMIYPAVIVAAMGAIGVFMLTSIIPKIAGVYKEFGADLPLPTKILITISDLLTNYTIVMVLLGAFVYFLYRTLRKNPTSDLVINNAFFHLPVFGALNTEVILAITCRTLGTLLASGVAILDALRIVSKTVANNYFRSGLERASLYVEKGLPLSLALKRNPDFPPMVSQLLAIGEETGTVDQSLERLAKFYQDSAERKVKALTTLLEPLMILLMGGMVAGLALAVLLPMFNLVNVIK